MPDSISNLDDATGLCRFLNKAQRLLAGPGLLSAAILMTGCGTLDSTDSSRSVNETARPGIRWQSAVEAGNLAAGVVSKVASAPAQVEWQHRTFPGKKAAQYRAAFIDGRSVIASESDASASMLRQAVRVEPAQLSSLKFSWKVPALIADADLADAEKSDSPARIVLAFEGDRSRFSARDAMMSELALTLTGEPMPYAMLMYVWGSEARVDTVLRSKRTDRVRKLVVESGTAGLGQWLDYERDVRADFVKAFGEEPGALVGVGIMSDTDNTRGQARAWYGPISLAVRTRDPVVAVESHAESTGSPNVAAPKP